MPISVKTNLNYGDVWYIKNDADQFEYHLVGIQVRPGGKDGLNVVLFILDYMGEEYIVYDFQCSTTKDLTKESSKDED
jgi:hypothetical protein